MANPLPITKRKSGGSSRQCAVALAGVPRRLKQEILHRRAAEASLHKSERHYNELLTQSRRMQEKLRQLSHQILMAQEEERKQISRELHVKSRKRWRE